jgi:hypothetical protein
MNLLENCKNLRQCEERLKQVKDKINLIGDINLKSNDIEKLSKFLKEYLRLNNIRNLKKIPFSVSVFLVWKGILEYKGNYWGLISEDLNLNLTNKKRDLLGSIILKTIRIYDLLDFTESEHNRKYVTPILVQGYIPNKYLENYFNFFLLPFFHKFEINKEEIRYRINNWREDHEGYRALSKNIKELEEENNIEANKLSRLRYIFDNWDNLTKYNTLKGKEIKKKEIDYLLKFPKEHLQDLQVEINNLKTAVSDIKQLLDKYNIGKELLELEESLKQKRNVIKNILDKY